MRVRATYHFEVIENSTDTDTPEEVWWVELDTPDSFVANGPTLETARAAVLAYLASECDAVELFETLSDELGAIAPGYQGQQVVRLLQPA